MQNLSNSEKSIYSKYCDNLLLSIFGGLKKIESEYFIPIEEKMILNLNFFAFFVENDEIWTSARSVRGKTALMLAKL